MMNSHPHSEDLDLHDADLMTRVMARCGALEIVIAAGALLFAIGAGLLAAPIG